MAYYDELTEVPNTGGEVFIYKIADSKKGIWYVRIKRLNASGYFTKTLKTTDMFAATVKANRYWLQVREAEDHHIILAPKNLFKTLCYDWFKSRAKNSKEREVKALRRQFEMYYIPFFGNKNVGNITERNYIEYLNKFRLHRDKVPTMRKQPTLRTLDVEQNNLMSFLSWCFRQGAIRLKPSMRKIIKNPSWVEDQSLIDYAKPQRRDMISTETYDTVRRFFRSVPNIRPRDNSESDYHEMSRRRLAFYYLSIYNFVCRAGEEILNLRFKDFHIQQSELNPDSYFMVMTTKYGKKVNRRKYGHIRHLTYYSNYEYIEYFHQWREFLKLKGYPTDSEALVFPVRKRLTDSSYHKGYANYADWEGDYIPFSSQTAVAQLGRWKKKLKIWADEKDRLAPRIEAEIDMFAAYSVRHLAIRNLIVESGYSMSRVAERANTGLTMIQDFYYKYGVKPEGRLVSKHPNPSPENARRQSPELISALSKDLDIKSSLKSGRSKYD